MRGLLRPWQALRFRLGLGPSIVTERVLGRPVRVRFGTVPERPDYDDGWTFALLAASEVMFDVGANLGYFSLLACLHDPRRRVVAIDANPMALATAAENLFNNGISSQARFILGMASDRVGEESVLYTVGTGAAGSRYRSHARTAAKAESRLRVSTTTLDHVARESGLLPDFIKMDVEGAESEALRGASWIAGQRKACFLVEMHSREELPMAENGRQVLEWCRGHDYEAYYLAEHRKVAEPSAFAHRGRCHLYLQPAGRDYPEALRRIAQSEGIDRAASGGRP